VACGAGFLVCELARTARLVCGVDLSQRMLREAHTLAQTLGRHNTAFCQGDAEVLPFARQAFDLVTCKLAFHYFPHPQVVLQEMRRIATPTGRVVLIDRISSEDPEKRAYQNRLEKLRTPAKTYVYSESQLVAEMAGAGLMVEQRATYQEHMDVHAWIQAAGSDAETAQRILALLTPEGDPAGLQVRWEGSRLMVTHQTCVLVARWG
jgi:ubiquinone/menaquinone biosynthesis C-methylase UbiE